MINFYEVKFQIKREDENNIAARLGLKFTEEYSDLDIYLKTKRKDSFKLKITEEGTIWYHVKFDRGIFVIMGTGIDPEQKSELLELHPVEIEMNRINRVYSWDSYLVKCDFDYIKQFPSRAFLKVYSISREAVENAKNHLIKDGFGQSVDLAYNKLYWSENPSLKK